MNCDVRYKIQEFLLVQRSSEKYATKWKQQKTQACREQLIGYFGGALLTGSQHI